MPTDFDVSGRYKPEDEPPSEPESIAEYEDGRPVHLGDIAVRSGPTLMPMVEGCVGTVEEIDDCGQLRFREFPGYCFTADKFRLYRREQPTDFTTPPFRTGDVVRHPSRTEPFEINLCERRTDYARVRWIVTDYSGQAYFAEDCIANVRRIFSPSDDIITLTLSRHLDSKDVSAVEEFMRRVEARYKPQLQAFGTELRRQSLAAYMRGDYATADRIAGLIGDPLPSEHEANA